LISYFPAHFPWHNQILENVFQLIFHYTTKHRKILFRNLFFPEFTFQKKLLSSKQTDLSNWNYLIVTIEYLIFKFLSIGIYASFIIFTIIIIVLYKCFNYLKIILFFLLIKLHNTTMYFNLITNWIFSIKKPVWYCDNDCILNWFLFENTLK